MVFFISTTSMKVLSTLFKKAIKSFFYIIFFLIIFEFCSYISTKFDLLLFNHIPTYKFAKHQDGRDWRIRDPEIGIWHKPFTKVRHVASCFNVEYRSNNIGARDDKNYNFETFDKSIILVGASFADGYGVKLENTFANIIEKKLKKNVINLGVGATNPKDHLSRFNKIVQNKNFSEIIYFFLPAYDFLTNKQDKLKIKLLSKDANNVQNLKILKYKIIEYLYFYTYSYNTLRTIKFLILNKDTSNKNRSYRFNEKKRVDLTYDFIKEIIEIENKKKTLIIIPTRKDLQYKKNMDKSYKNLYWYKQLSILSENNDTKLIDLYDFFDLKKQYKYYHDCDFHWSDYGNKFVAKIYLQNYN